MTIEFQANKQFYKVHESTYHQVFPREAMRKLIEAPERERVPFYVQWILGLVIIAFVAGMVAWLLMSWK